MADGASGPLSDRERPSLWNRSSRRGRGAGPSVLLRRLARFARAQFQILCLSAAEREAVDVLAGGGEDRVVRRIARHGEICRRVAKLHTERRSRHGGGVEGAQGRTVALPKGLLWGIDDCGSVLREHLKAFATNGEPSVMQH
jgi:hypothetical protein